MTALGKFLKPLRNERGAGVMMMAFAASLLIAGGTATVLLLSGQVSKEASRSFVNYQGDEFMKNSLIYTKTLIDRECLTEKDGTWTVAAKCQSTGEWELKRDAEKNEWSLEFDLCVSLGRKALEMSKLEVDANNCVLQPVTVTMLEMVGKRRKVRVNTLVGKHKRNAIAMIGSDITITPDNPDPDPECTEGIKSSLLTFEDFAEGAALDNAVLERDYGVRFESISGGSFKVARIAGKDESDPSFDAWASILCKGKPNHNRLCFNDDVNAGGTRILSTTEAMNSREIKFRIVYVSPVSRLKFWLADVDGGEKWTLVAYDAAGNQIKNQTVTGKGYGDGSGNSALQPYSVSNPDGLISKVEVIGTKNIKIFGFGFDNFETGLTVCPTPTPTPTPTPAAPAPTP